MRNDEWYDERVADLRKKALEQELFLPKADDDTILIENDKFYYKEKRGEYAEFGKKYPNGGYKGERYEQKGYRRWFIGDVGGIKYSFDIDSGERHEKSKDGFFELHRNCRIGNKKTVGIYKIGDAVFTEIEHDPIGFGKHEMIFSQGDKKVAFGYAKLEERSDGDYIEKSDLKEIKTDGSEITYQVHSLWLFKELSTCYAFDYSLLHQFDLQYLRKNPPKFIKASELSVDGTYREWDRNEGLIKENLSDGTRRRFLKCCNYSMKTHRYDGEEYFITVEEKDGKVTFNVEGDVVGPISFDACKSNISYMTSELKISKKKDEKRLETFLANKEKGKIDSNEEMKKGNSLKRGVSRSVINSLTSSSQNKIEVDLRLSMMKFLDKKQDVK